MLTNSDITIYNKYIDATTRGEKYQRTQVAGVMWEDRKAANVLATGGNLAADSVSIYIPKQRGLSSFVAPKAWLALVSRNGKWTLQVGDVIVRGLVADEIHDAVVSPPSAAFTVSSLEAKYDDVVTIRSVDTMDAGSLSMQHWQVGAG